MPLNGTGVEPRSAGGNHILVLHFDRPMQSGNASVTSGAGSVGSVSFSGNDMLVNLSGVTNQQRVTVTATNLTAVGGGVLASASLQMGFLVGDTSGNGSTNATDVSQTKLQSGAAVTASNFRNDVNVNGAINSSDVSSVKMASGTALP